MKRLTTLTFAVGLLAFGASAQSVVIVSKDGTKTQFGTDYIESITFEKIQAPAETEYDLSINKYSGSNIGMTFTAPDKPDIKLDVYFDEEQRYLPDGVYTVGTSGQFYIDNSNVTFTNVGGKGITGGSMTVSREGEIYDITLDFTVSDGDPVKGRFHGALNEFGPVVYVTLTSMSQSDINNPLPGEFRLSFNDANWKYSGRLDLYAPSTATTLPAGTYTKSSDHSAMTYDSTNTYIEKDGYQHLSTPITLEADGDNMNITFSHTLNGVDYNFTFKGKITYLK